MKKAEIIIATLSFIAIGLNLLFIPGSSVLTTLSLLTLSMFYCYFSFALFNNIRLRNVFKKEAYKITTTSRIIGAVGTGFALSLAIVGILFKFQFWPGADFNLLAGLCGLMIITVFGLIKYSKNKSEFYKRIFKRIVLIGGLGLVLLLIPKTSWVDIKYRNNPEYAAALKKAMADPNNKELWEKEELERKKMYDKH